MRGSARIDRGDRWHVPGGLCVGVSVWLGDDDGRYLHGRWGRLEWCAGGRWRGDVQRDGPTRCSGRRLGGRDLWQRHGKLGLARGRSELLRGLSVWLGSDDGGTYV